MSVLYVLCPSVSVDVYVGPTISGVVGEGTTFSRLVVLVSHDAVLVSIH